MTPRIEHLIEKKLIGKRLKMSLSDDKTQELWQSFMSRRKEIKNCITTELYCMQVYDISVDYTNFNQNTEFEKWAVTEVSDFDTVPDGMETYKLGGGKYAVFIHKGNSDTFYKTSQYIHETWLPNSEYVLDYREHFEILGEKYKRNDVNSEEEIWIPIKEKD